MKYVRFISIGLFIFCLFFLFTMVCEPNNKNLGGGFVYSDEHKHIVGKVDIPPIVMAYDYDNDFIIAKQKPKEYDEIIYDTKEYYYPFGRDTIYYWLIIKNQQKVIGPLSFEDFQHLKIKYKVPAKLKLK